MVNIFKSTKIFLIGLILLLSCSSPMFGGRPKIEKVTSTMRPLSVRETKELVAQIPEIFIDALGYAASSFKADEIAELEKDSIFLEGNLKLKELTAPLLNSNFPMAHFYQSWKLDIRPHSPYLIAIIGNKLYHMPSDFNRLLLENNLNANYKNLIELVKAFVILALEGQEVTFQNIKKSKRIINKNVIYWVNMKILVNNQKQIYGCRFEKGQILWATMNVEGGTETQYFDFEILENPLNKNN